MLTMKIRMKRFFVLAVSILPLIMTSSLQAATPNHTRKVLAPFTSKIGAFSVMMPGRPEYKVETVKTENGPVVLHKYIADTHNGHQAYVIGYSDFRSRVIPSAIFDAMRQDALKIIKGRLVFERLTSIDGHPGRVLKIESAEYIAIMRGYLVGRRFYKQIFVMTKAMSYPAEADRFFASFRVGANANTLARR